MASVDGRFEEFWGGRSTDNSRARQFNDVNLLSDDDFAALLQMKDALISADKTPVVSSMTRLKSVMPRAVGSVPAGGGVL